MAFSLLYLLFCALFSLLESKLISVQMLSRHGIRAPKASLVSVCPNYQNWNLYDVEPEALTGAGMMHMYKLGMDTRERYINKQEFLPSTYNYRAMFVRSSDSPRM